MNKSHFKVEADFALSGSLLSAISMLPTYPLNTFYDFNKVSIRYWLMATISIRE